MNVARLTLWLSLVTVAGCPRLIRPPTPAPEPAPDVQSAPSAKKSSASPIASTPDASSPDSSRAPDPSIPTRPGRTVQTVEVDGVNRSYILRIPKNYDSGKPAPLLMAFHGGGNSAELMESARQDLIDAGEEMGFIVVFAQGYTSSNSLTKASWNAAHCCGVSYRDQIDDIAYTREVVASLSASLSVNPDLVFATGFSNGGMMTHRVAAELSDVFAAAIPIAGSIGGQYTEGYPHSKLNETSGPISVLMINGRKDASIKYDGGKSDKSKGGRLDVSAPDGIRFWASEMGCSSTPQILNVADGVTFESFPNCDGGVQVALATVDEMAHAWPMKERVGMDGTWALFQFLSRVSGTRSR